MIRFGRLTLVAVGLTAPIALATAACSSGTTSGPSSNDAAADSETRPVDSGAPRDAAADTKGDGSAEASVGHDAGGDSSSEASLGNDAGGDAGGDAGADADAAAPTCTLTLPGDCHAPVAAYSVNAKIVSSYGHMAPLFRAVRIPDGVTVDVLQAGHGTYASGSGTPDVTQVVAWLAGATKPNSYAIVTKVYDQSGHGNDASQASLGAAPVLQIDPLGPTAARLSLAFSSSTANARAAYAGNTTEGSALAIKTLTNANPTTLTYAASPGSSQSGEPTGSPFPELPTPDYWVLPGFLVQDKSLPNNNTPDGGLPVTQSFADHVVLSGVPVETQSFSKALTIVPENVWLDLPAGLSVAMSHHTVMMAVRSGLDGTLGYVTLGQSGETPAGANSYEAIVGANSISVDANDSSVTPNLGVTTTLAPSIFSNDVDVYRVARADGTLTFDLGELGAGSKMDNYASTVTLSGGSIGFTNQVKDNAGSFEGFGFLVFDATFDAADAQAIDSSFKSTLALPTQATTQVVYTGASTVVGHGISYVEAPSKRVGEELVAAGHPARSFTIEHLSEDLLTDLENGGPVTTVGKQGTGTNVLVIHATIADSFGNYQSGTWPTDVCGAAGSISYEECLWTVVSTATSDAHNLGWKVLLVGGEPKAVFFGAGGLLPNFLAYKALEKAGWQAALADGYVDLESNDAFGGTDGKGNLSHCPFWDSTCASYTDPANTQTLWQPDGEHFVQAGYDLCADIISAELEQLHLY